MGWIRRLRNTILGSDLHETFAAETRFHLEEQTDDFVRRGMTYEAAAARARRRLGNVTLAWEHTRDADTIRWLVDCGHDLRYAGRILRKHPGFTVAGVLTVALGIGANTAVFSLINGLLFHRLPVASPERLVIVADPTRGSDLPAGVPNQMPFMWNYRVWQEIEQRPNLFESAGAYFYSRFDLASGGESEFVDGLYASGGLFRTLGVSTSLGRIFLDSDDRSAGGTSRVAMISHQFSQRRFGAAAEAIGRTVNLDRLPFTIVGILPRGFVGPAAGRPVDIVIPIRAAEEIRSPQFVNARGANWVTIMARLKPGQSLDAANAALRGVQPQIREASRPPSARDDSYLKNPLTLFSAESGNLLDPLRVRARRPLLTMQIAVALVLLIACANLANLTLARTNGRRPEMSLRLALGASPLRIARQLFAESLLLVLLGAAAAIPISRFALQLLVRLFSSGSSPVALDLAIDSRVLAFTALITIVTTLVIGMLPATRTTRVQPIEALKEQNPNVVGAQFRVVNGFVIGQIAASLVLVVCGGLLIRTYANLAKMDLGFTPDGVLTVDVGTQKAHLAPARRLAIFESVRQSVENVPGVKVAAIADVSPVTGAAMAGDVELRGRPVEPSPQTFINRISPGWLTLYGTTVINGRDFTNADQPDSPRVAIVNEAFVHKFCGGTDPLGRVVRQTQGTPGKPPLEWTIVGVVADAVYDSLRAGAPPTMYIVFGQLDDDLLAMGAAPPAASLSIRVAQGNPRALSRSIAAAIATVNPDLDFTFRPLTEMVSGALTIERTLALLSGLFSGLALLLASIGLYGVTSHEVTRRRTEIGIRIALGASRQRVLREILSRVLVLVGVGIAIGVVASLWASQFVTALLYGLKSHDQLTFIGAIVVLVSVGTLAAWLPARSAAQLDPMVALRCE